MAKDNDIRWIADWEQAKAKLRVWLVNPKRRGALIGDGPSVLFLNLCCVFYVQVFDGARTGGYIRVKHGLALIWGKTPEQLLQQATANIDMGKMAVAPLLDVINDALPELYKITPEEDEVPAPIYMLNNGKEYGYGASVIVSEQIRKSLCKRFGQDMYILPSSIHELMMVPADDRVSVPELQGMVESVNRDSVSPQDWLSDSVYLLRAGDASVTIAARG